MLAALLFSTLALAGAPADAEPYRPPARSYTLAYATHGDLRTWSYAGPLLHRATQDAYLYGLAPRLGPTADRILGTAWSVFFTYTTMLWPHELGHWSRAREVDSRFIFHNAMPLLPHTTVEMPDDATNEDRALLSAGGFEVNALVARQAQLDFYRQGGGWSDELAHALLNESFFTVYALIFPARATEAETWTNTRGDPVHVVLPVYERATGRPPVTADGEVDPELVQLYREFVGLSVAWSLLDPGLYQQARAFSDRGFSAREAWWPVQTERFAWTWGTLFQPSPLGYVLSLSQYLQAGPRTVEVALSAGRPLRNRGLRVHAPDLVQTPRLRVGLELEGWDQHELGVGGAASLELEATLSEHVGVIGWGGYKTEGYSLGRPQAQTPFFGLGLTARAPHRPPPHR